MSTPLLFQPISFRSVTARNRIVVAPMCQYSATDGLGDDWHVQHLGAQAAGGAGIVMAEATHVSAIGRITHGCLGAYIAGTPGAAGPARRRDHQMRVGARHPACPCRPQGILPGAMGRRQADPAWQNGGWEPVAPSAMPAVAGATDPAPAVGRPRSATSSASSPPPPAWHAKPGSRLPEIHCAHGYLSHSFLSPISNHRNDSYGGDLTGRARFLMESDRGGAGASGRPTCRCGSGCPAPIGCRAA